MSLHQNKDRLMWLLVVLCASGVVLIWLPSFLDTVWSFSESIGAKGKASQNAFLDNLKQVQTDFENALDEQKKTSSAEKEDTPIQALDESKLKAIAQELESFSKQADEPLPLARTPKSHCTRQGGVYEDRTGKNGAVYGVCSFTDGSECHALLFLRGKCHTGQYMKAEDGIPQWADLVIDVGSMEYCRRVDGILKNVAKEEARGICIDGLIVRNDGIAKSGIAKLRVDDKNISVRPLSPHESIVLPRVIIQKTPALADISFELITSFQEIDKENNTYHYAE